MSYRKDVNISYSYFSHYENLYVYYIQDKQKPKISSYTKRVSRFFQ